MSAIGREAAACPAFRWLPGMLMRTLERTRGDQSRTVIECAYRLDGCETLYKESDILANEGRHLEEPDEEVFDRWPDLDDDLTRLGLLALVRKAWSDPEAFVRARSSLTPSMDKIARWAVFPGDGSAGLYGTGPTEKAALVAALKAAPEAQP